MTVDSSFVPEIRVRDRRFRRDAMTHRWWMGGDPFGTAFYNALSAGLPQGEAFVIDSVRAFRDGAPASLAADIAAFTRQEVLHTREHVAFNRRVRDSGHDMSTIEAAIGARIKAIRAKPPIASITATAALEHFTSIIAHEVLSNPRHLAKAEPDAAAMWRWHAVEEIEHKGVSYDTWLHATRGWGRFRRWKLKAKVMPLVTRNLLVDRIGGAIELLRQDGQTGLAPWARLLWYLFGWPGLMRRIFPAWLSFFLPGFHPWNHDNRALLAKTLESMPAEPA